MELLWEQVEGEGKTGSYWRTSRARVPGGWLVRTDWSTEGGPGLTFVPDPKHEWK